MATFRFRANRWQARVRRKGTLEQTKSFLNRHDAERWARSIEVQIDKGSYVSASGAQRTSLRDLIHRYVKEVLPAMKGAKEDTIRLTAIARRDISKLALSSLTPELLGKHRDDRLQEVCANTVIREFAYLSSVINHARREWGMHMQNPLADVRKPASPAGRNRILTPEEQTKLLCAVKPKGRRSRWVEPVVILALETAMRRGELLALEWRDIDLHHQTAQLHTSKNGEARTVPLSKRAISTLAHLPRHISGKVFPITHYALAAAFKRAVIDIGLMDVHFHDLRHNAITSIATKLPNLIELSAVTGHKSLRMLQRYYHPSPTELAVKLG
jgi:integrase